MVFLVCLFFVFDFVKKVYFHCSGIFDIHVVHDLETVHVLFFYVNSIGKYFYPI